MPKKSKPEKTVTQSADREQRLTAIKIAMAQIEKQFGPGSIIKLGDGEVDKHISVIPTGSISLDMALGVGGLPRGRVIEIYGPEASGKTTLALHVISEAQKQGGTAAFIDAEHALDPNRAKSIGVKLEDLLLSYRDWETDRKSVV